MTHAGQKGQTEECYQDRAEKDKDKTNNISQSARHIAGLRLIRYGTITYIGNDDSVMERRKFSY